MKKTLLLVFGGFVLVLSIFAFFISIFSHEIHENHLNLITIDNASEQLQQHKELVLNLSKHGPQFDSIAKYQSRFVANSLRFYSVLFQLELEADAKYSSWKPSLEKALEAERNVLLLSANLGFKENGLLGEMRTTIHTIEAKNPEYEAQILSLRRHEKDYIMRLDDKYAQLFNSECQLLIGSGINPGSLQEYQLLFNQSKEIFEKLYLHQSAAFPNCINGIEDSQKLIRKYRSDLLLTNSNISDKTLNFQVIGSGCFILVFIFILFWIIQRYTNQVKTLRLAMDGFIRSNYETKSYFMPQLPKNEIGVISKHFIQLARKIQEEVKFLEENVSKRTISLRQKNEQLEKQHAEIVESLHYAQNLQQSLLVSRGKINHQFREAFIYYQPKNLVGGDFYWMREYKRSNTEFVLFALADCTGHGVPGALISVLGMNTLDDLANSGLYNPGALLNQLRTTIEKRFTSETESRLDGMDISVFQLNKKTGKLTFSGAQMPLWILRGKTVIELKGQRIPIGLTYGATETFYNQVIQLEPGDRILLFSDGFTDQFGGARQKKWGKKGFREALKGSEKLPTSDLFKKLVNYFEHWKSATEQTDDCSMVLFEIEFQDKRTAIVKEEVLLSSLETNWDKSIQDTELVLASFVH